jgi:hypothetical protein
MSSGSARLPDYLGHIAEAIERIQRYTAGLDEAGFKQSQLVQDSVIRNWRSSARPAATSDAMTRASLLRTPSCPCWAAP